MSTELFVHKMQPSFKKKNLIKAHVNLQNLRKSAILFGRWMLNDVGIYVSEVLTDLKLYLEWWGSLGRAYICLVSQKQRTILELSDCNKDVGNIIKDRQCTYSVTLRRVRATIVVVEMQ